MGGFEGGDGDLIQRKKRGSVFERLAANKQSGSVEEYIQDFEILVGQMKGVPEEQLMGYFMVGLQEGIHNQVRLLNPQELMIAMRIARDVEETRGGTKAGNWSLTKNPSSLEQTNGEKIRPGANRYNPGRSSVAKRSEANHYNPGRSGVAESVGSVRKEGSDNNGRNTRNMPYSEALKRREEEGVSGVGDRSVLVTTAQTGV
ncbi:hypothetical protein LR48_Vigan569s000200 [Vigna angularis]|uniref:Retrotransposon gag domain-containing protein n=2 Tax=Phaseolus angularis TaxID=3914 RepID=A0A0L9TEB1_PHAAN|nr:hypothetical protein LR48_Vigan569s000200 [Vigna angularis]BAT88445.1 hypothetical protein VIGAN_05194100 [Vigna angularis var. angularis]